MRQNGFSSLIYLLGVLVIIIIALIGYIIFNNSEDVVTSPSTETIDDSEVVNENVVMDSEKKEEVEEEDDEEEDFDDTVYDVQIESLKTPEDISKLPSYTPDSFKIFFESQLSQNQVDANGCINVYSISKISQVNINGGGGSELAVKTGAPNEDLACGGGAPLIWVMNVAGNWAEDSRNGTSCVSSNGGLVYEEFAEDCYDGNAFVANPNGSIKSLSN